MTEYFKNLPPALLVPLTPEDKAVKMQIANRATVSLYFELALNEAIRYGDHADGWLMHRLMLLPRGRLPHPSSAAHSLAAAGWMATHNGLERPPIQLSPRRRSSHA